MNERAAFVNAICENPGCDTARLVFADWLDETGRRRDAHRAEFIRAGVRIPDYEFRYRDSKTGEVGTDARVLFDRVHSLWADIGESLPQESYYNFCTRWSCASRGFVLHVELPCAEFVKTEFAKPLFASQPVTSVRLTDKEPTPLDSRGEWFWMSPVRTFREQEGTERAELLPAIHDRLSKYTNTRGIGYPSKGAALQDASFACVAYGRSRAGLPALPPRERAVTRERGTAAVPDRAPREHPGARNCVTSGRCALVPPVRE